MVQKRENQIFQGTKASKLNKLVLMALFENGCLSPWEIAKKVAERDPERAKKNWYQEAQKINSVLSRKNGRLTDLAYKEFIEKNDKGFSLTFNKGFCAALLCYEQIPKPAFFETNKTLQIFPELKKIIELARKYYPETELEDYKELRNIAQQLLIKGFNLELLSNNEFNEHFLAQQETLYLSKIKNKQDTKNSWVSNPEINEVIMQYLSRLQKICENQLADFRSTMEKIRVNSHGNSTSIDRKEKKRENE